MSIRDSTRDSSDNSDTSLSLLNLARQHDNDAWKTIVDEFGPRVYRWCAKSGVPPQDADDIAQDVLQAAAKSIESFRRDRPGDRFRKWLRTITANKINDYRRRTRYEPLARGGTTGWLVVQSQPDPHVDSVDDSINSDAIAISAPHLNEALEAVRRSVKWYTWEAFWRTAIEENSPADVASDLEMSIASVYKARARILQALRQRIAPEPST